MSTLPPPIPDAPAGNGDPAGLPDAPPVTAATGSPWFADSPRSAGTPAPGSDDLTSSRPAAFAPVVSDPGRGIFRPLFQARTWLETTHLLLDLPVGRRCVHRGRDDALARPR